MLASERARQACVELGCPPTDVNAGEGALSALLAKSSVYTADRPDLQSYAEENTSWPRQGSRPVRLVDAVSEADRFGLIDWEQHLLRSSESAAEARATSGLLQSYGDPALVRSPRVYGDFLQELGV